MSYVFDPQELHKFVLDVVGLPPEEMVTRLSEELSKRYPGHIRPKREWVFNNAGGAMGAMTILHASLTEYVIIFGTPIGTEGHTGRFFADDYFYILDGEQWAYSEGQMTRDVYAPGTMHHLPAGHARGYRIPDHCWALEYARGIIPLMLPFGVADTLSSTLDMRTLARTFSIYARSVTAELLQGKI